MNRISNSIHSKLVLWHLGGTAKASANETGVIPGARATFTLDCTQVQMCRLC